jgi:hypothetical protein
MLFSRILHADHQQKRSKVLANALHWIVLSISHAMMCCTCFSHFYYMWTMLSNVNDPIFRLSWPLKIKVIGDFVQVLCFIHFICKFKNLPLVSEQVFVCIANYRIYSVLDFISLNNYLTTSSPKLITTQEQTSFALFTWSFWCRHDEKGWENKTQLDFIAVLAYNK